MKKETAKEVAQVKWKWPVRCYELQHTNTQWLDNPLAECEGIRSGGMCSMHVNFYVLVFFVVVVVIASVMSIVCWICVLDHSARLRHTDCLHSFAVLFNNRNNCCFLCHSAAVTDATALCTSRCLFVCVFFSHVWLSFALLFWPWNCSLSEWARTRTFGCCFLIYTCIHCNLLIFFQNARENIKRMKQEKRSQCDRTQKKTIHSMRSCKTIQCNFWMLLLATII